MLADVSTLALWAPPSLRDYYATRQSLFTEIESQKPDARPDIAQLRASYCASLRHELKLLHKLLTHDDMEKVWVAVGKELPGLEEEFFSMCLESLWFRGQKTKKQEKDAQTKLVETLREVVRQLDAMGINASVYRILPDLNSQKKLSGPPESFAAMARTGLGPQTPTAREFIDSFVQYLERRWQMDADLIIKITKPALPTAPRTYCACFLTRYLLQTCGKALPAIVMHTVNVLFEEANFTSTALTLQQVETITEKTTKKIPTKKSP